MFIRSATPFSNSLLGFSAFTGRWDVQKLLKTNKYETQPQLFKQQKLIFWANFVSAHRCLKSISFILKICSFKTVLFPVKSTIENKCILRSVASLLFSLQQLPVSTLRSKIPAAFVSMRRSLLLKITKDKFIWFSSMTLAHFTLRKQTENLALTVPIKRWYCVEMSFQFEFIFFMCQKCEMCAYKWQQCSFQRANTACAHVSTLVSFRNGCHPCWSAK